MIVNQTAAFLSSEGDKWFERNNAALQRHLDPTHEIALDMISEILPLDGRILEIGCSNGRNLAELSHRRPMEGYGIDPSSKAIAAGAHLAPSIQLRIGTADVLDFEDSYFDVVWYGFCLYLMDRNLLMKSVAEADRVLRNGGFLVITDFDPASPCRRKYHHLEGLYSFKADYSALFLANPAYKLVAKRSYSHVGKAFNFDPDERVSTWTLVKSMDTAYQEQK